MFKLLKITMIALCLASCSQKTTTANIQTQNGVATYILEIADTPQKLMKGLMYRKSMPSNKGMLFIFPLSHPQPVAMWMKNTFISLDMLFLDDQHVVIGIAEKTVPLSLKTIEPTKKNVSYVIELNAGEVQKHQIKIGDKVLFELSN